MRMRTVMILLGGTALAASNAWAGEALYEFAAAPSPDSNTFYRLNTATGEINWCYYAKPEGDPVGKTVCDPAGQNAGPQKPGVYGLLPTNLKADVGIFRVDKMSGKVWQCYPLTGKTVCAAPAP